MLSGIAAILSTAYAEARAEATPDLAPPGFHELGPEHPDAPGYEAARSRAVQWLRAPLGDEDTATRQLAEAAAAALAGARLRVAVDADADRQCLAIRASLFVLATVPGTIFVCADTRWNVLHAPFPVTDFLAQGLAHEAVHLAGTADECIATTIELLAARGGGVAPNDGNVARYAAACPDLPTG